MQYTPILVHHSINHRVSGPAILGLNVKHLGADLNVGIESGTHAGSQRLIHNARRKRGELKNGEFI